MWSLMDGHIHAFSRLVTPFGSVIFGALVSYFFINYRDKQSKKNGAYTSALLIQDWVVDNVASIINLDIQIKKKLKAIEKVPLNTSLDLVYKDYKDEYSTIIFSSLHPSSENISCKITFELKKAICFYQKFNIFCRKKKKLREENLRKILEAISNVEKAMMQVKKMVNKCEKVNKLSNYNFDEICKNLKKYTLEYRNILSKAEIDIMISKELIEKYCKVSLSITVRD